MIETMDRKKKIIVSDESSVKRKLSLGFLDMREKFKKGHEWIELLHVAL